MSENAEADFERLQVVVGAKLRQAEFSLEKINSEIRKMKAVLTEFKRRFSQTPPLQGDATYAAFAAGKRESLRREIAEVAGALASLEAAQLTNRNAVSCLYCQDEALKSMVRSIREEHRRSKSRGP